MTNERVKRINSLRRLAPVDALRIEPIALPLLAVERVGVRVPVILRIIVFRIAVAPMGVGWAKTVVGPVVRPEERRGNDRRRGEEAEKPCSRRCKQEDRGY